MQFPWQTWQLAPPNWEAVAALVAVLAAWRVGRLQLDIQAKQSQIALNDLKIQLLKKRADCIQTVRETTAHFFAEMKLSHEQWVKLNQALQDALLIFPTYLAEDIKTAVDSTFSINYSYERASYYFAKNKESQAQKFQEEAFEQEDKAFKALQGLVDRLVDVSRIDLTP